MEENSELEEGEACYYKDDDDNHRNNNYVDPDVALSYIDEKLQNILGHFQKDFEGGVSAENLGAKFGGYGSFLPTYERSPSMWSRPKTPQRSSSTPMSPNSLPVEGAVQNLKIPPTGPSSVRLGITSDSTKESHNLGIRAGDVSVQRDSASIPVVVAQKSSFKDRNLSKPGNLPDQRTLKVRIKVGSDSMARQNAAIYSGLGLDNSPSSSLGNSQEESGGMLPVPQGGADESPISILQVMTSFPVPEGSLISPLHDSFLCLIRNRRLFGDTRSMPSLKDRQENSALLVNESTSVLGDGDLSKKKEAKLPGKSERAGELKNGKSINFDNDMTILPKKKLENDTPESNGARGRLFFPDSVKEDSLESVSGQSSGRKEKRSARNSSVEKVSKNRPVINKASAPLNVSSDASKCNEDLSVGTLIPSKQNIGQQVTSHVQREIAIPTLKEKPFSEVKKKSQSNRNSKRAAAMSEKESLRVDATAASRDMIDGNATSRDKLHKMKLQNDRNKVRDNHGDSLATKLEQMNDLVNSWERPCGDRMKDSMSDAVDIEQNGSFNKSKEKFRKEKFRGKTVDNRLMALASVKSAAYDGPCVTENAVTSEVVLPIVDPVLIEENWVCCDSCQAWRLLPIGTKPEQLPEKWLCSMLSWLPGMNRCSISEEETTRAVQALDLKNKLHNLDNGIGSGAASVRVQQFLQDHQSVDSQVASSQGKKKHGLKEIAKPGSCCVLIPSLNSRRDDLKESVKSRSLNDMNQLPAESNFINKSSVQHLSKSHEVVAEKHIAKHSEKHTNGGHDKQIKKKNKREAVHYGHETSKKAKKEDVYNADKHQIFDMDPMRAAFNSRNELTKTNGKNTQKSNKYSSLEDVNCDTKERLLAVTKDGTQAQASSDGGSMDIRGSDKRDTSVKKMRLMEWQDNQDGHDTHAEDGSENGLKNEKKSRISKSMAKEPIMKSANYKGRAAGILLSGNEDHLANGMEENRGDDKQQLQKHRRNFASQQTVDVADSSRRDFGSGQVSITATSSSSMISDSLKTRATGSPVESVSSSPLRASIPEKPIFFGGDINGVPAIDKSRRCREGENNDEINQSWAARKEEDSGRSHPERLKVLPYQGANADLKVEGKATSSDFLIIGDEIMEHYPSSSGLLAIKNCHDEDKADKDHFDNMLFPQKSAKGSSSLLKDDNISSTFDFDKDNMKVSNPVSEQEELCSKKAMRYDSEVDRKSCAPLCKRMNNVIHSIPEKSDVKLGKEKKDHGNWSDPISQYSKDRSMVNQLALEERDDLDAKLGVPRRYWNSAPQQNLIQDFEGETKDQVQKELRSLTPKLLQHPEDEGKQGRQTQLSMLVSQEGGIFDRLPVHASGSIDVSKASKHPGNGGTKNGTQQIVGHHVPHLKGLKEFNASSPGRMNSPSQTATSTLKEAKDLRDYADRLKSSGFGFESNESYFKAARKFLLGAALLETRNIEGGKQGEMTQMQAYSTAAKLCKCCALEYESRREMAAAALAYKCMEVAFWRVVYCKSSTSSRDHGELQASLHMIPQGESPSSSASDVDNLNNQASVDKAILSKGAVSHVAGNPVNVARNHSNFLKLLYFTQDVNFAMEASRKSQNAFSAANVALEGAQNRDCITSVKKVIDFSFHDVEGFMRLVQLAIEAISPSGFGGARE